MRRTLTVVFAWAAAVLLAGCGTAATSGGTASKPTVEKSLILATTTSTQDSGLLDELLPVFTRDSGWQVKTLAVGSGQAIELGRRGEADALLVHSPAAETEFVAEGSVGSRRLVMHNDFVLIGPKADPAEVQGTSSAEAMKKIAAAEAVFISRGDESGTHAKEKGLWSKAGVTPDGSWYQSTGQGMGETLRVASEKAGYTLSDRATYLAQRGTLALDVLSEGDPGLLNVYHVIEMTKKAGDLVRPDGAKAFADWIVGPSAQQLIGEFGRAKFGQPLFIPDAGKDEATLGQ
ncbi:substrate-binding domain-containing protein [Herbidospora mongoliensis]|uniref:substrate-binding domain-containing protein n=1 Tax=Herbidospora mongoliensis TaxID=688067 RepID=UPI000833FF72|nr:substrate-binding domain-containing protein [Herbidospora mongoliensis]